MWEFLGVVIAALSLGITILLERKRISSEIDQLKKDLVSKNAPPVWDDPITPISILIKKQSPEHKPRRGSSVISNMTKLLAGIISGIFAGVWITTGFYIVSNFAFDWVFQVILIFMTTTGFMFGLIELGKRSWWHIIVFNLVSIVGGLAIFMLAAIFLY